MQEKDAAGALLHQERHEGRVGLCRIAVAAGEDEVVRSVIRVLTATRPDMVQRNRLGSGFDSAISANRAMLGEEPLTMT